MAARRAPVARATGPDRAGSVKALRITLALTAAFTVVEVVGGIVTGSLALLADAAHMLSDNASLGIALFAAWLAGRPAGAAPSASGAQRSWRRCSTASPWSRSRSGSSSRPPIDSAIHRRSRPA
jgi:Cation efflux family